MRGLWVQIWPHLLVLMTGHCLRNACLPPAHHLFLLPLTCPLTATLPVGVVPLPAEYEGDVQHLQSCTQDELVQQLRSDGRRQAAQRMLKQKRDGAAMYHGDGSEEDDDE